MKKIPVILLMVSLFIVLSYYVVSMPSTSEVTSPSYNETVLYYIENAKEETGAKNIVAAILTDYRGFDTMVETIVLFTAIIAVVSVLKIDPSEKEEDHG